MIKSPAFKLSDVLAHKFGNFLFTEKRCVHGMILGRITLKENHPIK